MQVHFTYDVEIWVDGLTDKGARLHAAFRRLTYGPPPHERGALPVNPRILRDNGLRAVFLVEPLFSYYYGLDALQELIGLIMVRGHALIDRFFGWAGRLLDLHGVKTKVRRLIRGHG